MTSQLESPFAQYSTEALTASSPLISTNLSASLLTVIRTAMDGVIILDVGYRIVLANHKAEHMFGYSARQLLNRSFDTLLQSRNSHDQKRRLERFSSTWTNGRRMRLGLKFIRATGEEFAVNATVSRVIVSGEIYFALVLRDCSRPLGNDRKALSLKPSELRKFAVSSQQTAEVEKKRFSKELYDDIGQRLSVLKLDLDWLQNSLSSDSEVMPARVAQMQGLLDNVITMTKSMAFALRPPLLDDFGLMPAVTWITQSFQKRTSIRCQVIDDGMPDKLPEPIKSAAFRVIQEALLNIERHSQARNAMISIGFGNQQLSLLIADDGIGLAQNAHNKPGCYGLIAMQERIFILGGTITIQNMEPQGVVICASIPFNAISVQ